MRKSPQPPVTQELSRGNTPVSASNVVITDNGTLSYAQLSISIKEARKVLGSDGKQMSDDQIAELILDLTSISSTFLDNLGSIN